MAVINKLDNMASVLFEGNPVNSNTVETELSLPPTIVKAVDNLTASIGDVLTYTVTITSVSLLTMTNLAFTDVLPAGSTYVNNSFTLNGSAATPTLTSNTLTYEIPTILGLGVAIIQFQVTVVGGNI